MSNKLVPLQLLQEELAFLNKFHCPFCGFMENSLFSLHTMAYGQHHRKWHKGEDLPRAHQQLLGLRFCAEEKCGMYAPTTSHKCFKDSKEEVAAVLIASDLSEPQVCF